MNKATQHVLINSAAAIILAMGTSVATVMTASKNLRAATSEATTATEGAEKATTEAKNVVKAHGTGIVPIGAIVASTLSWEDFSVASGNTADFSAVESIWVPCDGRPLSGSIASQKYKMHRAPDLRGVFLRGLNEFVPGATQPLDSTHADPDSSRDAGSFQGDELRSHSHSMGYHKKGLANGKGDTDLERSQNLPYVVTGATGGPETRPKNVAVYYYMRIN